MNRFTKGIHYEIRTKKYRLRVVLMWKAQEAEMSVLEPMRLHGAVPAPSLLLSSGKQLPRLSSFYLHKLSRASII